MSTPTWWFVSSALIVAAVVVLVAVGIHNQRVENTREWVDVGTLVSVTVIPRASLGSCNKTQIKTSVDYTFVVAGIIAACRTNTKVYWSGNLIYLEGTGRTYELFESN